MENKQVSWIIFGITVIMIIIVFIFNSALKDIVEASCGLAHGGDSCPMLDTIKTQTNISLAIIAVVVLIGFYIMFQKPKEKIVVKTKTIKEKKKPLDLSGLESDEKKVVDVLIAEGKAMFQADLMEKLGIGKVGMTRLLDKLEAKQMIERKRRGMNNVVVLRD